jgi:branched-chain amino acid transport system substrate-binding protein
VGRALRDVREAGQAARLFRGDQEQLHRRRRGGPVGIWANSYDIFNWEAGPQSHKDYIGRLRKFTKDEYPSSWPITGYVAMQALVAGIKKANSIEADKVAKALLDITFDAPTGPITLRGKDHNANRGQFWGRMVTDPKYPFPVMAEASYLDPTKFMD